MKILYYANFENREAALLVAVENRIIAYTRKWNLNLSFATAAKASCMQHDDKCATADYSFGIEFRHQVNKAQVPPSSLSLGPYNSLISWK